MTPRGMMAALKGENAELRGLTGSGEPGLASLLGGTAPEKSSSELRQTGGAGQVSATSRIAEAYRDSRLAAVAAGRSVPASSGGGSTGGGGGTGGRPPQGRPPMVVK